MTGSNAPTGMVDNRLVITPIRKAKKNARWKNIGQFVINGIQGKFDIWLDLKGQIYLGDEAFMSSMQQKIGKEKDDLNIPQKQKRPMVPSLDKIAQQAEGRNKAIVDAYATGAYSQREIGAYFQLHPSTVGVIVRKKNYS